MKMFGELVRILAVPKEIERLSLGCILLDIERLKAALDIFEPQNTNLSHRRRLARWVVMPGEEETEIASIFQQAGVEFNEGKTQWLPFIPIVGGEYGVFVLPGDRVTTAGALHVEQQEGTMDVGATSRPQFHVSVLELAPHQADGLLLPQLSELIVKYFHFSLRVIDLDTPM